MWLIAGLGNPGRKYERNRHNIGFRVVDELCRRHDLGPLREKFGGLAAAGNIRGVRALVLKPMEYMNLSGFAVQRAMQFHGMEPAELLVVHDEIDLPFARLRLKAGGGHGGHNGVRSIVEQLGSGDFQRVRVGVGRPERQGAEPGQPGQGRVSGHVLADFPAEMDAEVGELVARASDAVEAILDRGIRAAMNDFNGVSEKPVD
ncbi:MAG TPA: aminoacyl-tRNA hydrolase [Kofleriaceae bacterium]|nr:aminoacyl-tRNA hydrolase [Kofleriaceae bacterium]